MEELLNFAEYLGIELTYNERLLPDLLRSWQEQCKQKELNDFIAVWAESWADEPSNLCMVVEALGLHEAEQHPLDLLVHSLGHSGLTEQTRLIQQFSAQMQRLLEECRREGERYTRLWRYCSIFSAAIIAIILL